MWSIAWQAYEPRETACTACVAAGSVCSVLASEGILGRARMPDKSCASDRAEGTHLSEWDANDTRRVIQDTTPHARDATYALLNPLC